MEQPQTVCTHAWPFDT